MNQPAQTEGSLPLGLLAGLFGGCIGVILVVLLAKGAQTKKGSYIGLGIQVVLGIIAGVLVPMLFGQRPAP